MKKIFSILKIIFFIFIVAFIVGVVYFYLFSIILSDEKVAENLNENGADFQVLHDNYQDVSYRYAVDQENFDPEKPSVFFVHGGVGSINTFIKYLQDDTLGETANLIAFDRPNYGNDYNSNYKPFLDFEADLLNSLAEKYRSKNKNIIVGHSYGGPIALAALYKREYDAAIVLAPAVDPEYEPEPLVLPLYTNKLTRLVVPQIWQQVAKENIVRTNDLENYKDLWQDISGNIIQIHGDNDFVIPYENVDFLQKQVPSELYTLYTLEGGGHGLVDNYFENIRDIILEEINNSIK